MDRLKGVWKSVRPLLLRRRVERELAEELEFHVDMEMLHNRDFAGCEDAAGR